MGLYRQAVQQLYVAYFNRPADSAGLAFWESVVAGQNGNTAQISAEFAKSAEYRAAYQGKSNAEVVNQVYVNLFGRPAEASGKAFWANALNNGVFTVDNVVTMVAHGAQGSDLAAYNAKVSGATAFTAKLTGAANIVEYAGTGGIAAAKDFISSITSADSLALAIRNDNLLATVAAVRSASNSAVTINLDTGVDSIAPSQTRALEGNDSFNALSTGDLQTINANDSINGGLGKNTLNISSSNQLALTVPDTVSVANIQFANVTAKNTVTLNTTAWSGLRDLTVKAVGGDTVTAASTTAIAINDTIGSGQLKVDGGSNLDIVLNNSRADSVISVGSQIAATGSVVLNNVLVSGGNSITVTGGSSVTVNNSLLPNNTGGSSGGLVTINGRQQTSQVSISNPNPDGKNAGPGTAASVVINDVNFGSATRVGTIHDVSLKTFLNATINDTGLSTLALRGGGTLQINNAGLLNPAYQTLALKLESDVRSTDSNFLTLADQGVYTKANIDTVASMGGTVFLTPQLGSVTQMKLSGDGNLYLRDLDQNMRLLESIQVSGKLALTADLRNTAVTVFDASGVTGRGGGYHAVTLDASKTSYTGGNSADLLTLDEHLPGKVIDGGDGMDTLSMSADLAGRISAGAGTNPLLRNFEELILTGAGNPNLDLQALGGVNSVVTSGGNGQIFKNYGQSGMLTLNGAGTSYTVQSPIFESGIFDTFTISVGDSTAVPVDFASSGVTVNQVERVQVYVGYDAGSGLIARNKLTINADAMETLVVEGASGLQLVAHDTALNLVDAHSLGGAGFDLTVDRLSTVLSIYTGSSQNNLMNLSALDKGVVYFGNSQNDIVKLGGGSNTLSLFGGNDQVILTRPNDGLNTFTTIVNPASGLAISLPGADSATFNPTKLVLGSADVYQDYANAVIRQAGDARLHGGIGWFQFGGNTWLVESHHDGSGANPAFINGTDVVIKLSGLIDLSHASLINGNTLVLA